MNNKHQKWKILFIQTLIILLFALIWEGLGRSSKNIFFLIGTPLAVAGEFWQLLIAGNFIGNFFITGAEAVVGLLIGTLIGTVLGLSLWFSESAAFIAKPFVTALGALPVFALAPLMIVWFGGSSRFCVISLIDIGLIDLCVLCVFVVRSTPSLGEMYLRIHFTHQSWESRLVLVLV